MNTRYVNIIDLGRKNHCLLLNHFIETPVEVGEIPVQNISQPILRDDENNIYLTEPLKPGVMIHQSNLQQDNDTSLYQNYFSKDYNYYEGIRNDDIGELNFVQPVHQHRPHQGYYNNISL